MEMIQFHPTCFCKPGCPPFLVRSAGTIPVIKVATNEISEAVRGEGGILKVQRPDGL